MHRLILVTLVLGASAASAAPLDPLPRAIPARCTALAHPPASATIPGPALASHISVAKCMAEVAMNATAVTADDASIAKLDAAVAPAVDVLDSVIRVGDAHWKVVAENAKRDIYGSMIVRERVTVPGTDVAAHAALEPKLVRWQEDENEAAAAIARITHQTPQMAHR